MSDQPPIGSTLASPVPADAPGNSREHLSPGRRAWRRFKQNRAAVVSAWFLLVLLAAMLLWPLTIKVVGGHFARTHEPDELSDARFAPPSAQHWFGTDAHGRDVFSRTLYGAQISLLVGFVGAGVSLVIGVLWGAMAGYLGGRVDSLLMRIVDILYSLPSIIFVIVLITTLRGNAQAIALCPTIPGGGPAFCAWCFCLSAWGRSRGSPWRASCAARS